MTEKDLKRFIKLVEQLRGRALPPHIAIMGTLERLEYLYKNHLEKEYNQTAIILHKHGFKGAPLAIYATYLIYGEV